MEARRTALGSWIQTHRQALIDVVIASGLLALAELLPSYQFSEYPNPAIGRTYGALIAWLAVPQILPLAFRRVAPVASVLIIIVTSVAPILIWGWQVQPGYVTVVAVAVGIYSVAAHRSRAISLPLLGAWLLVALVMLVDGPYSPWFWAILPSFVVAAYLPAAGAWIAGDYLTRRRSQERLRAATAALEESSREEAANAALAEQRIAQAAANERMRIARELHDVVAHNMSVMVVQAGAARRILDQDPQEAARSIASVERAGREGLNEMRRLLGVVRKSSEGGRDLAPQPGVADIQALIDKVGAAGITVDLVIDGTPRPLPQGLDLSVYRLIQEALTNTIKHAHAKRATVNLVFGPDLLTVRVTDDGHGLDSGRAAGDGSGYGLIGLRERVAVFGSDFQAGNVATGDGFFVAATLPFTHS